MKKLTSILLLLILISCSEIKQPPGILAEEQPKQTSLSEPKSWDLDDFHFVALANFELKAKVLGKERYTFGTESEISPYDLALGWGKMSDQSVVDKIEISQSSRWFFWKVESYPISKKEIEISASNMHIIPANEEVENQLSDLIMGEIIYLKGYLVEVNKGNNWHWKSSLSRNDTGNGACEVVWVNKLLRIK